LAENLDALRYQLGRYGRVIDPIPGKIVIDLPTTVGMEFVNAIETKIISTTTASWDFWYGLLDKFTSSEGHARPSQARKWDGCTLGIWVTNQRSSPNSLTPDRIARLEALPGWVWDVREFRWEEGFSSLQRFTALEGHSRPPSAHKENGYNLGQWVSNQRSGRNTLTPERIIRLETLPGWVWDISEFQWEEGFSYLQRLTAGTGHSRPIKRHKENGYSLGEWVGKQRASRNHLTSERIARLEALPGWIWDGNAKRHSA
jgi:hypothetical protein